MNVPDVVKSKFGVVLRYLHVFTFQDWRRFKACILLIVVSM